jgi:hypothetical protein
MNLIQDESDDENENDELKNKQCHADGGEESEQCQSQDIDKTKKMKLLQRYVLIAFYNTALSSTCVNKLEYEVMYPYPFAGYTRTSDQTMHWEEILITLKFDLSDPLVNQNEEEMMKLLTHFNLTKEEINSHCPLIVFLPRHQSSDAKVFSIWKDEELKIEFHEWVWGMLKMSVKIINKTPWVLHHWWIHGNRGNKLADIPVGDSYHLQTFISHAFLYRPSIVEGNALNNQVSLRFQDLCPVSFFLFITLLFFALLSFPFPLCSFFLFSYFLRVPCSGTPLVLKMIKQKSQSFRNALIATVIAFNGLS